MFVPKDYERDQMNEGTRAGALAAVLAGAGLLAAACGHAPNGAGEGKRGTSTYQQAVAFAKCMRSHGDPSFPDPGPGGAFPNKDGSLDRSSPQFKKASAACRSQEPGPPAPSTFQQDYRKLLKYSACMRAHGLPKFPDPVLDDHGVGIEDKVDQNSPQFKNAQKACRSLMPGGGGPR
jgi:hypothetical protein